MKAKGLNLPVEKVDQLIEKVSNAKDEELPTVDAAIYSNEKQDMVFKADVLQDGKETMHAFGGMVDGCGVSEYQMGDQMYSAAMVGKGSVNMTVKAMGMEIDIKGVIEARQNGKAAVVTMALSGMELMKAEIELIDDAVLTGKFDTGNKVDITVRDIQENQQNVLEALRKDYFENYIPALNEKLQKVAPEMLSIFEKAMNLVEQAAPTVLNNVNLQPQPQQ